MERQFIIFGAGKLGQEMGSGLEYFGLEDFFYTDNNPKLWGMALNGKLVVSPKEIIGCNRTIIIAVSQHDEVYTQLEEMALSNQTVSMRAVEMELCNDLIEQIRNKVYCTLNNESTIIFDCIAHYPWGGGEKWSYILSNELKKRRDNVLLVADSRFKLQITDYTKVYFCECAFDNRWEIIKNLVLKYANYLPCTIICAARSPMFFVAHTLKTLYPELVRIIAVQHSDISSHYNISVESKASTDRIIGVSKKICEKLHTDYGFDEKMIAYKGNFTNFKNNNKKLYSGQDKPVKICYFGRIEVQAKRMDLLPHILSELETINKKYIFNIAGKGAYENTLKKYVIENNLQEKVLFNGFLQEENLSGFLNEQDIFFSCSDFEGSSLSLIEAMSFGVVPVVTNVSGVDEFVTNGINGYTCRTSDIKALVSAIDKLEKNRNLLPEFGEVCKKIVRDNCSLESYVDFIEKLIV